MSLVTDIKKLCNSSSSGIAAVEVAVIEVVEVTSIVEVEVAAIEEVEVAAIEEVEVAAIEEVEVVESVELYSFRTVSTINLARGLGRLSGS